MKHKSTKLMFTAAMAAAVVFQASAADPAPAATPAAPAPAAQGKPITTPTLESILSTYPDVLAEVNGKKITKKELIKQLGDRNISGEVFAQIPAEMRANLIYQAVNEMIDQQIMLLLAEKDGFKPSEALVKEEMDKSFNKLPKQQRDQFEASLKSQGKDFASYRDSNAKNPETQKYVAIMSFLQKNVFEKAKAEVKDAEVEKFYRENQKLFAKPGITVSHIFVMSSGRDQAGHPLDPAAAKKQDETAKAKIDGIYAKLKQGVSFEDLAKKESECPSGKSANGKLPAFSEEGVTANGMSMDPIFVKASMALTKPGQISEVTKSSFGYHIIRLDERKPTEFTKLDDVKDAIKSQLANEKVEGMIQALLEQGKKDFKVTNIVPAPEKKPDPAVEQDIIPGVTPAAAPAK